MRVTPEITARFESKISAEPNTGCWLWMGSLRGSYNYGSFALSHTEPVAAHRYAYAAYKGAIPEGMQVCHTCDIPTCVNPAHLFIGTQADNMKDKVSKNRQAIREGHGMWKGGISDNHREYLINWRAAKRSAQK